MRSLRPRRPRPREPAPWEPSGDWARGRGVLVVSVGNQVGTEGALCPMGDEATGRAGRGGECQRTALPGSARWLHEAEQNFQGRKSLQRGARATGQAGGSVPPADMSGQPSRRG